MKSPLLSIIIPCYQAAQHLRTLPERIDLTSQQSIYNVQFVIVDSNSTDNTGIELLHLQSLRPDLLLPAVSDRVGPGMARNIGLEYATGDFIAFLDVDDRFDLDAYLELAQSMKSAEAEVGAGGYEIVDLSLPIDSEPAQREIGAHCVAITDLLGNHAAVWRYVFSRAWLEQNQLKFPPTMLGEDFLFVLDVSAHSPITLFIDRTMCTYFIGQPGQATNPSISNARRPELLREIARRAADQSKNSTQSSLLAIWFMRVWGVGFRDSDSKGKFSSIGQLALWTNAGNPRSNLLKALKSLLRTSPA